MLVVCVWSALVPVANGRSPGDRPGSRFSRFALGRETSHVSRASAARPGTQGDTRCPLALRTAELRGECLIALAAVEQMPPHGGARLRDSTCPDRTHDFAMLLLEYLAVDAPGQPRAAGYGLTRDDETPEVFQEASELWIAGGIRDTAMKRK